MCVNPSNSGDVHLDPVLLWVELVGVNKQFVYMNESVRSTSGVCCYKTNPQICRGLLSEIWMYVTKDEAGGQVWGTDAGIRSMNPLQFHLSYRSVQSEVNVKTLQINPESDRSSISCQRYHFPSKWYGWQFDNCHPELASLKHSPKTPQILQGTRDEITDSHILPSLSKNTTICRDVYKRRYA